MASQGSDRLRAILAAAQEKAQAALAALPAEGAIVETDRVEALLDRNEALPDPRALARMYRRQDLVERLPEDEEAAAPAAVAAPPAPAAAPVAAPAAAAPAAPPLPGAPPPAEPARPPLSPSQIRAIIGDLREQFQAGTYQVYEPKPLPVEVIPTEDDLAEEAAFEEEPNDRLYIVGGIVALLVIGVFVLLALNGPLRYHPPAGGPSPAPTAASAR